MTRPTRTNTVASSTASAIAAGFQTDFDCIDTDTY
jgi:hypothetical protein